MDNHILPITHVTLDKLSLPSLVSAISPKDKNLLEKTVQSFRPNSIRYEDSWGYIIQSTRNGGFKWYDAKNDALIFFGRKSSEDDTLVVPNFFADPDYLTNVVNKVEMALHISKTVLKNINPNELSQFIPYGFREYNKNERWSTEYKFDDQTYPQVIIDLKTLVPTKGRVYHPLRKALYKNPDVIIKKYKTKDKNDILKIFALNDGNLINSNEKLKGMYYVSHAMYPAADIDKFVIIDNKTGQLIGFTATSDISPRATSLVASLFKPSSISVGIWAMYQTMVKKYLDGFQIVSLGGSETENTFKFKLEKFHPVELLYKTHLVYDP